MLGGNDWFLVVWAIVCIVVVLGMAYWVTKYLAGNGLLKTGLGRNGTGKIRVVEQQMLGRDQRLVVVQAGETYYLLGMTANNISLISEIDWEPTDEAGERTILEESKEKPAFREAFFDALRQKTRR